MTGDIISFCGVSGSGKTKLCCELLPILKSRGEVFGFYSPGNFDTGSKTAIDLVLLPQEKMYRLCQLDALPGALKFGKWYFFGETLTVVKKHLKNYNAQPYVMFDEIGPLEVEQGKGWTEILDLLKNIYFKAAIITYRPSLSDYFRTNYPDIKEFRL